MVINKGLVTMCPPKPFSATEVMQHPAQVLQGSLVIVARNIFCAESEGSERPNSLVDSLKDNFKAFNFQEFKSLESEPSRSLPFRGSIPKHET